MCVAVVVPAGQRLTDDQLQAMHKSNRDSWGFGFRSSAVHAKDKDKYGYCVTVKDVSNTEDMIRRYHQSLDDDKTGRADFPHLAHFRIRTAGQVSVENAHPFPIKDGLLIHNGHLGGAGGATYSDTYYFAKMFAEHLSDSLTEDQISKLGSIIGKYNKLALLHKSGKATIINEKEGTYLPNGIWVSNTYWQYNLSK